MENTTLRLRHALAPPSGERQAEQQGQRQPGWQQGNGVQPGDQMVVIAAQPDPAAARGGAIRLDRTQLGGAGRVQPMDAAAGIMDELGQRTGRGAQIGDLQRIGRAGGGEGLASAVAGLPDAGGGCVHAADGAARRGGL